MQGTDGLCNMQTILEELGLVLELHLFVENVLKGNLVESRVFVNKQLSPGRGAFSCGACDRRLLSKLILHLFNSIEIGAYFHVKACFTYQRINFRLLHQPD